MWKSLVLLGVLSLLAACKSPPRQNEPEPPQGENPSAALEFDRIEAATIKQIAVHYRLKVSNPRPQALEVTVENWKGFLNGIPLDKNSAALHLDGVNVFKPTFGAKPFSSVEKPMILFLELNGDNDCLAELSIDLGYHYRGHAPLRNEVTAQMAFPRIQEPGFAITAITILQADLINTRLKLNLRIDNPNMFPITLASFRYELYGDGSFWAGDIERDLAIVPAQGSSETCFNFVMNFIGMRRRLLDDIIAMRQVRYRIAGDMEIGTGIPWLPVFRMDFDYSGESAVLR